MAGQLSKLHWEMTHISVTHCLDQSPSRGHAQFQRSEGGNPPVSVRGELASSHPQGPGHTKAHSICPRYTRSLHTHAVGGPALSIYLHHPAPRPGQDRAAVQQSHHVAGAFLGLKGCSHACCRVACFTTLQPVHSASPDRPMWLLTAVAPSKWRYAHRGPKRDSPSNSEGPAPMAWPCTRAGQAELTGLTSDLDLRQVVCWKAYFFSSFG